MNKKIDDSEDKPQTKDNRIRNNDLYTLCIKKGYIGDLKIRIWDKVRQCTGVKCKISNLCPYENKRRTKADTADRHYMGPCIVEKNFLASVEGPFFELLEKVQDPFIMQWVGLTLIPLYHDLCVLMIEKLSIAEFLYEDSKGNMRVHPIFGEISRVQREIINTWKSTGLLAIAKEAGYFKLGRGIVPTGDVIDGDGEWYEEMASGV